MSPGIFPCIHGVSVYLRSLINLFATRLGWARWALSECTCTYMYVPVHTGKRAASTINLLPKQEKGEVISALWKYKLHAAHIKVRVLHKHVYKQTSCWDHWQVNSCGTQLRQFAIAKNFYQTSSVLLFIKFNYTTWHWLHFKNKLVW